MKILGTLMILIAFMLIAQPSYQYLSYSNGETIKRFEQLWQNDLELLKTQKKLPKEWSQISNIELVTPTELTKSWVGPLIIPIQINSTGNYSLELILTDWTEKSEVGIVVQYRLMETKTRNIISDFGRTFIIN